ncbi:hypothetical protein J0895_08190 [Phormidium pseudopriestleyi FRX01]|uniref:Uncharacterized protein n=1 Tax=Phormidium pseudopriestleyi FRX01 TaxID=1759528 RepID=A0ABS3FPN9_9CYAN|nr:hypothetical protein [Phormidium pseudopriestleyi]MBO0349081.1 hypothetical protein [Phormidium pseudopriestleyi FRX01]
MLQVLIKGFTDVLIAGDGFKESGWRLAIAGGSAYHNDDSNLGQQWGR